jgi:hypothetical protein
VRYRKAFYEHQRQFGFIRLRIKGSRSSSRTFPSKSINFHLNLIQFTVVHHKAHEVFSNTVRKMAEARRRHGQLIEFYHYHYHYHYHYYYHYYYYYYHYHYFYCCCCCRGCCYCYRYRYRYRCCCCCCCCCYYYYYYYYYYYAANCPRNNVGAHAYWRRRRRYRPRE